MKQTVGEFLATLRRANGYTQQEVADRLGVSNRTLSAWERDTSAPDILLLPVLADLYGVTVDEILRGERRAAEEKPLSKDSKARIYKSRLATFTLQSWVLTGVVFFGLILFFAGWFTDIRTIAWVGWQWWILLFWLGLGMVVLGLLALVALWKFAEMQADDEDDEAHYGTFCILLWRQLSSALYIFSALSFIFGVIVIFVVWDVGDFLALIVCFLALAVAFYAFGFALTRISLAKWGGEDAALLRKKDDRRIRKLALFGLIPLVLAIVAVYVTSVFTFPVREYAETIAATREEFTEKMETISITYQDVYGELMPLPWESEPLIEPGNYYLRLSEVAETATPDEWIDLGYGFTGKFNEDKSECHVTAVLRVDEEGNTIDSIWQLACRIDIEEGYHVYDLYIHNEHSDYVDTSMPPLSQYAGVWTEYRVTEDGYALVHTVRAMYEELGAVIALALLAGDVLTCFAVYYAKREKLKIKL